MKTFAEVSVGIFFAALATLISDCFLFHSSFTEASIFGIGAGIIALSLLRFFCVFQRKVQGEDGYNSSAPIVDSYPFIRISNYE